MSDTQAKLQEWQHYLKLCAVSDPSTLGSEEDKRIWAAIRENSHLREQARAAIDAWLDAQEADDQPDKVRLRYSNGRYFAVTIRQSYYDARAADVEDDYLLQQPRGAARTDERRWHHEHPSAPSMGPDPYMCEPWEYWGGKQNAHNVGRNSTFIVGVGTAASTKGHRRGVNVPAAARNSTGTTRVGSAVGGNDYYD